MIAVIGAGPAGLASAAELQRLGEQVLVLERDDIGAAWKTRYDRLHLHTVRWLSCLPGYRIPREFGKWRSRDRVLEYLQRYVQRHALDVQTGIEAERIDATALAGSSIQASARSRQSEWSWLRVTATCRSSLSGGALSRARSSTPPITATPRPTEVGFFM